MIDEKLIYEMYHAGNSIEFIALTVNCEVQDIVDLFTPKPVNKPGSYTGDVKVPLFNSAAGAKKGRCPDCMRFVVLPCHGCELQKYLDKYGRLPEAQEDPDYIDLDDEDWEVTL